MNEQELNQGKKKEVSGIFIAGFGQDNMKPYPAWRYNDFDAPRIVNNTEEDAIASDMGWKAMDVPITGVRHLSNWRHDLEDMTAKQLVLFAKEEFGVNLPVAAGEEELVRAMWQLTNIAPQHSGRITLLAQSVEMDYDKTCAEIYSALDTMEFNQVKEMTI